MLSRRVALQTAAVAALMAVERSAGAQDFPSNVIRIVVPTPPGSPPDVVSRILANELTTQEGWRLIVENRPGAIQTLGVADVLKQPADGHTLLAMTVPMLAAPALVPKSGLRLDRDVVPVIKVSTGYNVLVVNPALPANSIAELVALLKSQPGKLHFASGGVGNPAHLIGEMFLLRTGTRAVHVPYPQGQQFVPDLLSGTTQFSFITSVRVTDLIEAGKLRALAIMGPTRIAALKNVPSIVESGFPDLAVEDWVGFGAKTGTPSTITLRLNHAVNRALGRLHIREALLKVGHEPVGGTPAEFGGLINSQLVLWQEVIRDAGIKSH
jgi:tripartite-type tricarboxylate transporter receptor subunit TctC